MRRLRVGFEIDVDHAEDHPLTVGRHLRISDALQLHHVVEREGMLGLSQSGEGEGKNEKGEKKTAHEGLLRQTDECNRGERVASSGWLLAAASSHPKALSS